MKKLIIPVALSMILALPALAGEREHDRARKALEAGEVLPLKTILDRAEAVQPGQLLEAELEDEHGGLVYELKLLTPDGKVSKLLFDARTGELLKRKDGR
ncbi:MAG TPA: PepSY domain-containing protein [Candidatus Omnitrophota bacterium]|nr:PepSY domain-containing protein [Candidatus Omnitrophota bacterium]